MSSRNTRGTARAFGILSSMTMLSRVTGYARDAIIAAVMGASGVSDAFFVAYRIPNMFRRLFGEGALTPAIVPVAAALDRKPVEERDRELRSIIAASMLSVGVVTVAGILASPLLVRALAWGFSRTPELFALTVDLTRITFPYLFFISAAAVYMGLLNARHHFLAPSLSPVILNLSMIATLVAFHGWFGTPAYALAWGVCIGGALQLLFHIPFLRREGLPWLPAPPVASPSSTAVAQLVAPAVFGLGITQINVLIDTMVATLLREGTVSFIYYADRLLELPVGVFTVSFATALLPQVSAKAVAGDRDGVRDEFLRTLKLCALFIMPSTLFLIVLGKPALSVLFERKAFSADALGGSYRALLGFAWGLPLFTFNRLVTPLFYAWRDAKAPVRAGFVAMLVNTTMDFVLMPLGVFGLTSATSLSGLANAILLHRLYGRQHGRLFLRSASGSLVRISVAAVAAAVAVELVDIAITPPSTFTGRVVVLCAESAVFAATYVLGLALLKVQEAGDAWRVLSRRFSRG